MQAHDKGAEGKHNGQYGESDSDNRNQESNGIEVKSGPIESGTATDEPQFFRRTANLKQIHSRIVTSDLAPTF